MFCPCTYRGKRGEPCVNFKEGHLKGHQNKRGHIIGSRPHESYFTYDNFMEEWARRLRNSLAEFQGALSAKRIVSPSVNEADIVSQIHHGNMKSFYRRLGGVRGFVSHTTCFCCLREQAEHPLPCGHVLCAPCVKGYGTLRNDRPGCYIIASCPSHDVDTQFTVPWEIQFKPPLAGVRILSLDG